MIGSAQLLAELERIRSLVLAVPLSEEIYLPTQTAVDALWRLEETLRYALRLQAQAQSAFQERAAELAPAAAPRSGAVDGSSA